jgi:hypothetical protein
MDSLLKSHAEITEVAREEKEEESSEKYIYHFDDPLLKESGYIQVFGNKIVVLFPEQTQKSQYCAPVKQFYINKQLVFTTNWLPITTSTDFLKCQDIFNRFYAEYTTAIHWNFWPSTHASPKYCNEISTLYNNSLYSLSCFENSTTTSIELDLKTPLSPGTAEGNKPLHVQLYVGPHQVFCSERELSNMDTETVHFILSYVLYKLASF